MSGLFYEADLASVSRSPASSIETDELYALVDKCRHLGGENEQEREPQVKSHLADENDKKTTKEEVTRYRGSHKS